MTDENYGAEAWRQPDPAEGDTVLVSEHGRILPALINPGPGRGVDCRSHSFKLVRGQYGGFYLLVRHGGGDERFKVDYSNRLAAVFEALDSDARYYLLHTLLKVHHTAERAAQQQTATKYAQAFAEGRLRKRRKQGRAWVEIVPPPAAQQDDNAVEHDLIETENRLLRKAGWADTIEAVRDEATKPAKPEAY